MEKLYNTKDILNDDFDFNSIKFVDVYIPFDIKMEYIGIILSQCAEIKENGYVSINNQTKRIAAELAIYDLYSNLKMDATTVEIYDLLMSKNGSVQCVSEDIKLFIEMLNEEANSLLELNSPINIIKDSQYKLHILVDSLTDHFNDFLDRCDTDMLSKKSLGVLEKILNALEIKSVKGDDLNG